MILFLWSYMPEARYVADPIYHSFIAGLLLSRLLANGHPFGATLCWQVTKQAQPDAAAISFPTNFGVWTSIASRPQGRELRDKRDIVQLVSLRQYCQTFVTCTIARHSFVKGVYSQSAAVILDPKAKSLSSCSSERLAQS